MGGNTGWITSMKDCQFFAITVDFSGMTCDTVLSISLKQKTGLMCSVVTGTG